jgi:hypothetical protein
MKPITTAIDFFPAHELRCKGTGIIRLDPRFADALPKLRKAWGKPLTANSVCRSPSHNAKIGGNPNSLHMTENKRWNCATMAADIAWRGWPESEQLAFAKLALKMGWRVGLHDGFCHIDRLYDLHGTGHYPAVFLYGTYTGKLRAQL